MTTHTGRLPKAGGQRETGAGRAGGSARAAERVARRAFHSRRLPPALLAAALVTVAGALLAIETISALLGGPARLVPYERVASWAMGERWQDWAALLIAALIVLVGLFFLAAGLRPGHGGVVPLRGSDPGFVAGITRRGLRSIIASAVRGVEGVTDVGRVTLRRHTVRVVAGTGLRDPGDLAGRVEAAVRERLAEIGPAPPPRRVAVRLRGPDD